MNIRKFYFMLCVFVLGVSYIILAASLQRLDPTNILLSFIGLAGAVAMLAIVFMYMVNGDDECVMLKKRLRK